MPHRHQTRPFVACSRPLVDSTTLAKSLLRHREFPLCPGKDGRGVGVIANQCGGLGGLVGPHGADAALGTGGTRPDAGPDPPLLPGPADGD